MKKNSKKLLTMILPKIEVILNRPHLKLLLLKTMKSKMSKKKTNMMKKMPNPNPFKSQKTKCLISQNMSFKLLLISLKPWG